ncbi:VanZ family protein [Thioalkalicoccus limnaeus]|uniref:VanZ family protein n=1 Tax=Thioalkalicoccus limnaeus TaxID=120681 RepID=A0ABV4BF97_9GAMM
MYDHRVAETGIRRHLAWTAVLLSLVLATLWVNPPDDPGLGWLAPPGAIADPWLSWLRWTLLATWVTLILGAGWWLTRPARALMRGLSLATLALLLTALLLPPSALAALSAWLGDIVPFEPPRQGPVNTAALGHFGLFLVIATLVFAARLDLGWWRLFGILTGLAIISELLQFFVDGRHPSALDVLIDLLGILCGALLIASTPWLRPPRAPQPADGRGLHRIERGS